MDRGYQVFNLIEEITLLDDTQYFELANIFLNGIAEYALNQGYIKGVRIVKLNVFHSKDVEIYEKYINENYQMPDYDLKTWKVWQKKDLKIKEIYLRILKENGIN